MMCLSKRSTTNQKIKLWRVRTMEKPLFEQMGGTYTRVGDYYLPALTLPTEKENISVYGDRDMQSI
jgi:hypothetical protein